MSKAKKFQGANCIGCGKYKKMQTLLEEKELVELATQYWELQCSLCLLKQYICKDANKGKVSRDDAVEIYAKFLDEEERADKWKFATIALSIMLIIVILGRGSNA